MKAFVVLGFLLVSTVTLAAEPDFTGNWVIDFRPAVDRQEDECGTAAFHLVQSGEKVTGEHVFATLGCGRLNEGGEGTVSGIANGDTAVLVVTSGRNGAVVLGKATLKDGALHWEMSQEISAGESGEALILERGVLTREVAQ